MEAVLEVYERPYDPHCPVVALDESPKQLIGESRPGFIDAQGIKHQDYEYQRNGVADMYMLTEPKTGWREVHIKDNHKALTYAEVIQYLAEEVYPQASKITLVEDNHSAHKLSSLYEILPPQRARAIVERVEVVRTPKHGSWLNVAEIELSVLTRQGLSNRVASKEELQQKVKQWYEQRNQKTSKVDWQFTTKDARIKLKNLYPKFNP